jgi:hypothetical protein
LFITIPQTNDRLVLHRFDIEEALDKAGVDFLIVTSQPPDVIRAGETLTYQLVVKSKKGGIGYRLDSSPRGMTLSPQGEIKWKVPDDFNESQAEVIVTVRDASGLETFHTFSIKIN